MRNRATLAQTTSQGRPDPLPLWRHFPLWTEEEKKVSSTWARWHESTCHRNSPCTFSAAHAVLHCLLRSPRAWVGGRGDVLQHPGVLSPSTCSGGSQGTVLPAKPHSGMSPPPHAAPPSLAVSSASVLTPPLRGIAPFHNTSGKAFSGAFRRLDRHLAPELQRCRGSAALQLELNRLQPELTRPYAWGFLQFNYIVPNPAR